VTAITHVSQNHSVAVFPTGTGGSIVLSANGGCGAKPEGRDLAIELPLSAPKAVIQVIAIKPPDSTPSHLPFPLM